VLGARGRQFVDVGGVETCERRTLAAFGPFPASVVRRGQERPDGTERRRRRVRQRRRDRQGVVDDPGDEPDTPCGRRVHRPAGEHHVPGDCRPDRRGEPVGAPPRTEQAVSDTGLGEAGRRCRHPEITRQRQLDTTTPCGAVDAADDDALGRLDPAGRPLAAPGERRRLRQPGDAV